MLVDLTPGRGDPRRAGRPAGSRTPTGGGRCGSVTSPVPLCGAGLGHRGRLRCRPAPRGTGPARGGGHPRTRTRRRIDGIPPEICPPPLPEPAPASAPVLMTGRDTVRRVHDVDHDGHHPESTTSGRTPTRRCWPCTARGAPDAGVHRRAAGSATRRCRRRSRTGCRGRGSGAAPARRQPRCRWTAAWCSAASQRAGGRGGWPQLVRCRPTTPRLPDPPAIELDGWLVLATDLGARGGTTLRVPGRAAGEACEPVRAYVWSTGCVGPGRQLRNRVRGRHLVTGPQIPASPTSTISAAAASPRSTSTSRSGRSRRSR